MPKTTRDSVPEDMSRETAPIADGPDDARPRKALAKDGPRRRKSQERDVICDYFCENQIDGTIF